MQSRLTNRTAVITGASSGLGRAIAQQFLAEGANIAIFSRNAARLQELAALEPGRVLVVPGDVTQPADLARLATETMNRFGKVDVVIPGAAVARSVPFADMNAEVMTQQFGVNCIGAAQTVRSFLPYLKPGSTVIFLTTFLTQVGYPGLAAYSASKSAIKSITQTLAAELAPRKIRVNAIAPGPIAMPIWGTVDLAPEALGAASGQVIARMLTGSIGASEDIAHTAVFLASDDARNICGQEIVVDCGYTVG